MSLEALQERVLEANLELVRQGLVLYTFGNVSAIDRERGLVVIKPSGVDYDVMKPEDMVVVDLEGKVFAGSYRPSSDLPTHLELYKAFPEIGGVTHTHSVYATVFAQAGKPIPCLGTTHADFCYGDLPVTRPMTAQEIAQAYEKNTGLVIVETVRPLTLPPGVLVYSHGPFSWGKDAAQSVYHAKNMEYAAEMAFKTLALAPGLTGIAPELLDKHYLRKHGKNAYYGQK